MEYQLRNNNNDECNFMRKMKPEFIAAKEHNGIAVLQNGSHQGLVKANRALLLLASSLMVIVFILGFLLMPEDNMLNTLKTKHNLNSKIFAIQNPVTSSEINELKGQLVGLISGSIESKLRLLEASVKTGQVSDSLGTIQGLKSDVKVLQKAYLGPKKLSLENQQNQALLQEVSQLKRLIYFTLTSCGLMVAAIAGLFVRRRYFLTNHGESANNRTTLGQK